MTSFKIHKKNHVFFVIDESGSMQGKQNAVVKVFDGQIKWLAQLSKDMDQETRVSVYTLSGNTVSCVTFDTDVLRLPSLAGNYHPANGTPLIQATVKAVEDLKQIPQIHGDHAVLGFVLTDGMENTSQVPAMWQGRRVTKGEYLAALLASLPDNWTLACLVPDIGGKMYAEQFGFAKGNIAIWDVNSATGVEDVGEEIKAATQSFYTSRQSGIRSTDTLFTQNVTAAQVASAGLAPISPDEFMIVPVALASTSSLPIVIPKKSFTRKNPDGIKHVEIMPFIQETGRTYVAGSTFYELVKSEKWEPHKQVALIHRQTKQVYRGEQCKKLLGLTSTSTRVRPQPVKGGDYDVFIQSTSVNRHLPIGSRVLIFK